MPDMHRNLAIDFLRGVAAFFIVGVHVVFPERTSTAWLLHDYSDVGVTVFAALAGYFMPALTDGGWRKYVCGRIKRLLVPYITWSIAFLIASMGSQLIGGGLKSKFGAASFWLAVVFAGYASTHLWFLIWLFYFQCLLMPALPKVPAAIWGVIGCVSVGACTLIDNRFTNYPLRLLAFFLIGYSLKFLMNVNRMSRMTVVILATVALGLFGVLHGVVHTWWLNLLIVVTLVPVAVVCGFESRNGRLAKVAALLGATSMGVYLVHPLFSVPISRMIARCFDSPYGCEAICLAWFIAYGLSLATIIGYRKVAQ